MLRRITPRPGRLAGALCATAAAALSVTAVASAATPTVTTGVATAITQTSVTLNGHVDPNGVDTDFAFQYGPTTAYGATTLSQSAGAGTASRHVSETVTGLQPGTVYHFRITGASATGAFTGGDATFTTAGAPPSTVQTGPAVNVERTIATPTGSINPNGPATTYQVQYGLTTAYGLESFMQGPIAAGFAPVPVSIPLSGLAPAKLFHYRIVAYHGAIPSYGADATFFTEPQPAPSPSMTTKTTPSSDSRSPYTFTTSGALKGGTYIPSTYRCTGTVGIRYYAGKRQLASAVAGVSSGCTFSAKVSFKRTHGKGSVPLRVTVYHRSNGYLGGESKTDHVKAG